MKLSEFRKLTENMDGDIEIKIYDDEYDIYTPLTEVKHTDKDSKLSHHMDAVYFLGLA